MKKLIIFNLFNRNIDPIDDVPQKAYLTELSQEVHVSFMNLNQRQKLILTVSTPVLLFEAVVP